MDLDSSSSSSTSSTLLNNNNNNNKCTSDHVVEEHEEEKHIFHVLAVDDSNIDRKLLERLLTVSSYQVTCVESGDKALEYLGLLEYERSSSSTTISCESSSKSSQQQVSKINLIMTDYSMPGISGYDLLKRIKDSSWKDVPVVVMSSENVPSRINMCLEGGAEEFLLKPVKLSDLSKLESHILKHTISHDPSCQDEVITTTIIDDDDDEIKKRIICKEDEKTTTAPTNDITNRDEKTTTAPTNDITNRDENESDVNCSSANKRRATLATLATISSDLSRPRVQELSVS